MHRVIVEIDDKGRTRFKYEGFVGDQCIKEAAALLERLKNLGLDVEVQAVERTQTAVQQATEAVRRG